MTAFKREKSQKTRKEGITLGTAFCKTNLNNTASIPIASPSFAFYHLLAASAVAGLIFAICSRPNFGARERKRKSGFGLLFREKASLSLLSRKSSPDMHQLRPGFISFRQSPLSVSSVPACLAKCLVCLSAVIVCEKTESIIQLIGDCHLTPLTECDIKEREKKRERNEREWLRMDR